MISSVRREREREKEKGKKDRNAHEKSVKKKRGIERVDGLYVCCCFYSQVIFIMVCVCVCVCVVIQVCLVCTGKVMNEDDVSDHLPYTTLMFTNGEGFNYTWNGTEVRTLINALINYSSLPSLTCPYFFFHFCPLLHFFPSSINFSFMSPFVLPSPLHYLPFFPLLCFFPSFTTLTAYPLSSFLCSFPFSLLLFFYFLPLLIFPYVFLYFTFFPTLPYLTLPNLTLPYLTLSYLTLPYLTLPYLT